MKLSENLHTIFLTAIACVTAVFSFAQQEQTKSSSDQYKAIPWTTSDGLPEGNCRVMLKDKEGFLWIGSQRGGLCRVDGSIVKKYSPGDSIRGGINSTNFFSLVEDSLHNIWAGTDKGLSRYDIRADTFTNIPGPDGKASYGGASIIPFWATKDEVFCYDVGFNIASYNVHSLKPKSIKQLSEKDSVDFWPAACYGIYDTGSNSIWLLLVAKPGLLQISLADGRVTRHDCPVFRKDRDAIGHRDAQAMCYDKKRNCIWLNGHEGLVQFNLKDRQYHYSDALDFYTNQKNYFRYAGIDMAPNGNIWLATGEGILIFDPETQQVSKPFSDPLLQQNAGKDNMHLYCDRNGIVWASNYMGEELYQIVPEPQPVKRFAVNPKQRGSLSNSFITTILPGPDGKLWLGTLDGLNIFDPVTETFEVLRAKDLPGIKGTAIIPLYIDTIRQKAWINATDDPLTKYFQMQMYEMDLKTRKCRPIVLRDGSTPIDDFSVLHTLIQPYKGGILFCDEHHGLFELKEGSRTANLMIPFKAGFGNFILHDDRHIFLHSGGAPPHYTFENQNGKWTKVPHFMDSLQWYAFHYNKLDQKYWVSTNNALTLFDKEFRKIRDYKKQGWYEGVTLTMHPDNDGKLWMVYKSKEIVRFDPSTGIFSRLTPADGYGKQAYSYYTPNAKDNQGNIYFGIGWKTGLAGPDWGLDRISPSRYDSTKSTGAYIQTITINQKPFLLSHNIIDLEELFLRHDQNTIKIETGIIDFFSRDQGKIRYRLEHDGQVSEWQYPADKIMRLEDLAPATYRLSIQSSNASGEYIGAEKKLLIHISPPFWQTWWFRILVALVIIGIIFGYVQYRSRSLKKRNILLEKMVTERTSELRATQDQLIHSEKMASLGELTSGIAHEIKNPLNFINNFSELNLDLLADVKEEQLSNPDETSRAELEHMIKTLKKNSEKINHHGKRVDDIVKSMLQHSRVGNLVKEPVNVNALCEESLKLAYHGFKAKEKTFQASFETHFDPGLPQIMAIPQELSRVLLNLFNNAFYAVHEKKKKLQPVSADASELESSYTPVVTVTTKNRDNKIVIVVSDNGAGIPQKIINKIFQPFFTTKPTGEGTGLGLSMSYDIITKSHGGELHVNSREGEGTDFEIMLPV